MDGNVNVLLYQENGVWVAQGVEYDMAAQGNTDTEALDSFERVFLGQIHLDITRGLEPLQDIDPMPDDLDIG